MYNTSVSGLSDRMWDPVLTVDNVCVQFALTDFYFNREPKLMASIKHQPEIQSVVRYPAVPTRTSMNLLPRMSSYRHPTTTNPKSPYKQKTDGQ